MSVDTLEPRIGETAQHLEVLLWPEGPPGGKSPYDEIVYRAPIAGGAETNILRNVSTPSLTVYKPDPARANGVGVIVAPGGGWRILAWEHEGTDVARWLAARGYAAFLLKYRLRGTPPDPAEYAASSAKMQASLTERMAKLKATPSSIRDVVGGDATLAPARAQAAEDGRRAVAMVRERAKEWGIDPGKVGMIGFSAGAFLVADVAVDGGGGAPLAFAAPIYGGETGGKPVAADAPPLFVAVAVDDLILFKSTRDLFTQWTDAGRPAELHAYTKGGHGFGMARLGLPSDNWIDAFGAWLADLGFA